MWVINENKDHLVFAQDIRIEYGKKNFVYVNGELFDEFILGVGLKATMEEILERIKYNGKALP